MGGKIAGQLQHGAELLGRLGKAPTQLAQAGIANRRDGGQPVHGAAQDDEHQALIGAGRR